MYDTTVGIINNILQFTFSSVFLLKFEYKLDAIVSSLLMQNYFIK